MTDWKGAFKKGISGFRGGEYGDAIASFTEVSLCPAPLATEPFNFLAKILHFVLRNTMSGKSSFDTLSGVCSSGVFYQHNMTNVKNTMRRKDNCQDIVIGGMAEAAETNL